VSHCLRCGTCCSLHIIGAAGGEDLELLKLRNGFKKAVEHNGRTWVVFKLKCKHLANRLCRIHTGKRPKACDNFCQPGFVELWSKVHPGCGYVEAWRRGEL